MHACTQTDALTMVHGYLQRFRGASVSTLQAYCELGDSEVVDFNDTFCVFVTSVVNTEMCARVAAAHTGGTQKWIREMEDRVAWLIRTYFTHNKIA
ncbi:hypothetical protein CYMTET_55567 [Cymbomonas tetramitiformis]|uniref:Uncharacterized protein n=1 Tax=Cymbomonas tetramitiformis TaxID=36881 RepID=A0AAE0BDX9_9CHLO|nr:hypothetical protein CYMTET_55567 [Cymbomonas tetramitiformis]